MRKLEITVRKFDIATRKREIATRKREIATRKREVKRPNEIRTNAHDQNLNYVSLRHIRRVKWRSPTSMNIQVHMPRRVHVCCCMAVGTGGQGGGAIAPPPQYFANPKNSRL